MDTGTRGNRAVVVVFEDEYRTLDCDQHMTMVQVSEQWQGAIGRAVSVAFFTHDQRYLPDDRTIANALANSTARSLELHAFPKSRYWVQVFGLEDTRAAFEVAAVLTPAAVRREIGAAVEIYTDDFRLTWDDVELDQELPFKDQGLIEGALLMVDLRVIVKVSFADDEETQTVDCFGSDTVGDLRHKLECDENTVLVATSPYRHVLSDFLRVCYIVSEVLDLEIPLDLTAERKVMLAFEPITLEHLRQMLPVALSSTPLDMYDLVSDRFQLATEFRLAVNGQHLDNCQPLLDQIIDFDDVIQIDIVRPFIVSDLWEGPLDVDSFEEVYLYSTESSYALYLRDELSDQRLFHDDISLTIFGAVVDVFGAISGQEKPFVLVDRDIERSLPILTFDRVMWRLGWARDMLLDIVPTTGHLLPEIMRSGHLLPAKTILSNLRLTEDTLMITEPEKIFISSDKKLRMYRFAHGATYGDVRTRMQLLKGSLDVGLRAGEWHIPNEAKERKLDRELLYLTSASRFQTRLTVTVSGQWFGCWFQPQQVSFTDVMVSVGKQAEVMPRHLFSKALYCCGCGRKLSLKEESHQTIPANCCSLKSLQLTDRRVKDVGIQSAGSRRRDVATYTLDPESRDACVATEFVNRRAVVSASPEFESTASVHSPPLPPPPPVSMRIWAQSPEGEEEQGTVILVEGSNCGALLTAVDHQLAAVPLGDSPAIFSQEAIYYQNRATSAIKCFDEKTDGFPYIDLQDGRLINPNSLLCISIRFLHSSSPLPSSPSLQPLIAIRTKAEFFSINPRRQLQPAPATALTDPAFVALLRGVRSGWQFFWEHPYPNEGLVHSELGDIFNLTEIIGGPKHFVFALLRDGDRVPFIEVPEGFVLRVFRRASLEVRVRWGCVHCAGPPQPADLDLWSTSPAADQFEMEFAAAARSG